MKTSTKPMDGKAYGSIPHFTGSRVGMHDKYIHVGMETMMTKEPKYPNQRVYVTEKMDGSCVAIGKKNGKLCIMGRAGHNADSSPYRQHHHFAQWVYARYDKFDAILDEGERIVGEWLLQRNTIAYPHLTRPDDLFAIFDFFDRGGNRFLMRDVEGYINVPKVAPTFLQNIRVLSLDDAEDYVFNNYKLPYVPEGFVYRIEWDHKCHALAKWVRADYIPGKYMRDEIWQENDAVRLFGEEIGVDFSNK